MNAEKPRCRRGQVQRLVRHYRSIWASLTRGLLFVLSGRLPAAQCKKHYPNADVHHPQRHIEPDFASDQRSEAPDQSCQEEADCCNLKPTRLPWSPGHRFAPAVPNLFFARSAP
jgi:hypothetical protein